MAFRRRSFRRTGRSYRRRGNARTSRGRTSGRGGYNRRRYTGRRRKMTSRRVRDIASRKKYDTIFGATQNDVQSLGRVNLFSGTNYFMWCPTWRQRRTASTDEHVRANQEVFMRGINDPT
jgi:hypothetical protein